MGHTTNRFRSDITAAPSSELMVMADHAACPFGYAAQRTRALEGDISANFSYKSERSGAAHLLLCGGWQEEGLAPQTNRPTKPWAILQAPMVAERHQGHPWTPSSDQC